MKFLDETAVLETIEYLEKKGFENIKADIEGYQTPKSYLKKGTDETITPNIVAEREGVKHYFELGLKQDNPTQLKSKWRFLEVLTQMKNQKFKIVTRKGHFKFTNEILDDLNLYKDPIKL